MEEAGPAGVETTLTFENADNMMELPIIKYDQKQVETIINSGCIAWLFCSCDFLINLLRSSNM